MADRARNKHGVGKAVTLNVPTPMPPWLTFISGLISTRNNSQVNKFPGLGDIPILGAFFRDNTVNREERELLMIVTPHLVQPLAVNAQLPSLPGEQLRNYDPNFYRMFFLENGDFDSRSGLSQ